MRTRREVVEHLSGTLKMRMGATHLSCKTLPKVATEMALSVLGYNLTRVINIVDVEKMMEVVRAQEARSCACRKPSRTPQSPSQAHWRPGGGPTE